MKKHNRILRNFEKYLSEIGKENVYLSRSDENFFNDFTTLEDQKQYMTTMILAI